jgi:hypothetical protein
MPATITLGDLEFHDPVRLQFGFTGIPATQAQQVIRSLIRENWPDQARPDQSVYSIRVVGEVAIAYGETHSPVVYIGEGNAFNRLSQHSNWMTPLLLNIPQLGIEVHVVETKRRNNTSLYMHIEADLIDWFAQRYGTVPWFNRQRERSKAGEYDYDSEARNALRKMILPGIGKKYLWAIRPTDTNEDYETYAKRGGGLE